MCGELLNIGVDIGGTNIVVGAVSESGEVLAREDIRTDPARGSQSIIESVIDAIKSILRRASVLPSAINSIGLGVPGTTDVDGRLVVFAPNISWRNVDIVSPICRVFEVPVYLVQDTRAAAWGEYLLGAGQSLRGVASITLGTGIGCGMVLDGKIFRGAMNTAGEFGHQIIELNGRQCNCGRHGCLEAYAGGLAIVRDAKEHIPNISELLRKSTSEIEVQDVFRLAHNGIREAHALTNRVVMHIGLGLVNLINISSVEMICLSGGISNAPDELLLEPLSQFIRCHAYETVADRVYLCRSPLGENAPMIGAALLYLEGAIPASQSI